MSVVAAYKKFNTPFELLHQKLVYKKSRYYKKSGKWTLWLNGTLVATTMYWGSSKSSPPRDWAEEWIERLT